MMNPRTINLSEEDMAALARHKITNLPTSVSPLISKTCREMMMMETAKKMGITPTVRFRAMLYVAFGAIIAMERDPTLLIQRATTQAMKGYFSERSRN